MITASTRLVVQAFLDELNHWRLRDFTPALWVVHRRLVMAQMIQAEVGDDDLEALALQALAEAVIDLCWSPQDLPTLERYVAARQAHLDVLKAAYNSY